MLLVVVKALSGDKKCSNLRSGSTSACSIVLITCNITAWSYPGVGCVIGSCRYITAFSDRAYTTANAILAYKMSSCQTENSIMCIICYISCCCHDLIYGRVNCSTLFTHFAPAAFTVLHQVLFYIVAVVYLIIIRFQHCFKKWTQIRAATGTIPY